MGKVRPPGPEGQAPVSQASKGLVEGATCVRPQENAAEEHHIVHHPPMLPSPRLPPSPSPSHHHILKGRIPGRQAPCCPLLPELGIAAESSLVLEPWWPWA